jgi:hypothetical protein
VRNSPAIDSLLNYPCDEIVIDPIDAVGEVLPGSSIGYPSDIANRAADGLDRSVRFARPATKIGVQTVIVSIHELFVQLVAPNWTAYFPSLKRRDNMADPNSPGLCRRKGISDLNCNPDAKRGLAPFVQSNKELCQLFNVWRLHAARRFGGEVVESPRKSGFGRL